MNNSKENLTTENLTTKITDQIKRYKTINDKSMSHLYSNKLFDCIEEIPENWSKSNTKLANNRPNMFSEVKLLPFENFRDFLRYVNVLFFNEIKEKLQNSEKNSKTTKIKINELDETPSKLWKSKVENYVAEVEFLLRKILKSIDDERNFTVTMILSNDFAHLLKNKLNNSFYCFAKFDNLLQKYNIQFVNHDFLNKSSEYTIYEPFGSGWKEKKINSNWKENIILLVITKKEDDFRFKIHNTIEFWSIKDPSDKEFKGVGTITNFDKNRINLSKAEIFAIKS